MTTDLRLSTKKKKPTSKKPAKPQQPWETLMRLMGGKMTPAKAAGTGLFLMLFGAPFVAWGTGVYASIGFTCVGFGTIAFIIGILWGVGLIDPKKDFK